MSKRLGLFAFLMVLCTVLCAVVAPNAAAQRPSAQLLSSMPLVFEPNQGQAPAAYQFLVRRNSSSTFFLADGVDVVVPQSKPEVSRAGIRWAGANTAASVSGEEPLQGRSNYFRGSDSSRWVRNVPQFAQVRYKQLYPGIDLVFHGSGDTLEHDFILQAGAKPGLIRLHIDRPFRIERSGDLVTKIGNAEMRLLRPVAYQGSGESRKEVAAKFVVARNGDVKFRLGSYDRTRELVIDPVFVFSTYLDGSGGDEITAVTTDASGNVYVTGFTGSTDFPITNANTPLCPTCSDVSQATEAFVSKLDPTGHTLLYSTFLGGSKGALGYSIAVDKNGNIHVAGVSPSGDFPNTGAVPAPTQLMVNRNDFFVASISADGSSLIYSGLIGGMVGFYTYRNQGLIAVDPAGNTYLTGITNDANFLLTPGTIGPTPIGYPFDTAFVLKVDPTGKLIYSTLIPGNIPRTPGDPAYNNNFPATGIAVDANGQVTLAGIAGLGLPTTPGVVQATFPNYQAGYVLQLNATATKLNFATYLPGTNDLGGLAVDTLGNFYVAGMTSETNLPVSANAYQKSIIPGSTSTGNAGYLLELDPQGKSVLAATYLSGSGGANFWGIALDSNSNVVVGGFAFSADFPLKNPLVPAFQGSNNYVVAEMSSDLSSLLFSSFFGASYFTGLTVDATDHPVIVGTGMGFPTTPNSFQPAPPPRGNTFISKLDIATPAPSVCLAPPALDFGVSNVGTPTSLNLNITNCGNATLLISSITSSLPSVVARQGCTSIAAGSTCSLSLTFTPADTNAVYGTLTLTDNAAIPQQVVILSGQGGTPQASFPPTFTANDLFVGTQAEFFMPLLNIGNGTLIVTNATATGDFTADNRCTSPVAARGICVIGVIFAPKAAGRRTGTLSIFDNAAGSPHTIQLSGNGLSTYPVPQINAILAVPMDAVNPQLQITGANFFPTSQVLVNGATRTSTYFYEEYLVANLTASDLAQAGELQVSIVNPNPGGGTSNTAAATVYAAMRNIGILHSVYEPNSGLLYGSVSTSSTNYPNQIVVIDPAAATVKNSWSVGNGPNQIAVSDDGQFLYVGLDGDKKVAQVALPSGQVNFAVGLGNDMFFNNPMVADAIRVLPGQPHAWAVTLCSAASSPCGEGLAVFDDAVQRPTRVWLSQLQPDSLLFVGSDASILYGTTMLQSPPTFYKFSINNSGATETQAVQYYSSTSPGGGLLDTDGTSIFVSNGQVINPADLTVRSTIPIQTLNSGMRVDTGAGRVYFAGPITNSRILDDNFEIDTFGLGNGLLVGFLPMREYLALPEDVFRWGSNGLGVNAQNTLLLLRTSLTQNATPQISVSGTTSVTVNAGQPASYTLIVAPMGGYSGQVAFSCANLPQYASCAINPSSANLSSAAVSITVAISTSQVQTAALHTPDKIALAGVPLLCGLIWLFACAGMRGRNRKIGLSMALLAVFFVIAPLAGCGGGGGGSSQPPPATTLITPRGTYTVNFVSTGSGVSKTTTLTLVVQ